MIVFANVTSLCARMFKVWRHVRIHASLLKLTRLLAAQRKTYRSLCVCYIVVKQRRSVERNYRGIIYYPRLRYRNVFSPPEATHFCINIRRFIRISTISNVLEIFLNQSRCSCITPKVLIKGIE